MKECADIEPEFSFLDMLKAEVTTILAVGTAAAVVAGVAAVQGRRWEKAHKKWLDDEEKLQAKLNKQVAEGNMTAAERAEAMRRFNGEAQSVLDEINRTDPPTGEDD